MLALAVLAIVPACSGEDDEPVVPQASDPNVAVPDPEGTVTVNITNNGRDGEVALPDLGVYIYIDEGNNFRLYSSGYSTSIVSLGAMKGLGNVVSVPTEGWSSSVAVMPGNGYAVRSSYNYGNIRTNNYARLYVDSYMTNTSGGIMGATVKYQSPFVLPIVLSESEVEFEASGGSREIAYTGSTCSVKSAPEWCSVRFYSGGGLTVSVTENFSASEYTGDIVLSNQSGEATLKVTQAASPSPLFADGRGTVDDPFSITAPEHLDSVRVVADGGYVFSLDNDIDLSDYLSPQGNGWMPIGSSSEPFDGTFLGNMHTISGLWIYRLSTGYLGLFACSDSNSSIDGIRLVLDDKGIVGTGNYVGGICGLSYGNITRCSVQGAVAGGDYVGGIAGYDGSISQCYTEGEITGDNYVGGVGSYNSTVDNCYSTATVQATGGHAFTIGYYDNVYYSYFAGKAEGGAYYHTDNYCYYDAETTGDEGGLPTSEMFRQATYVNWDFINVWQIDEGRSYPTLRCFDK